MRQNTRAGLIPERILKEVLREPNNTWQCEVLAELAGRSCDSFDSCTECIDFTLDWFYGDEAINYDE